MSRPYKSALREEQAESTRQRILAALADELAAGADEFRIAQVAERAGVSVRTVYQHFPNREAQIRALADWLDARMGTRDAGPSRLEDVPAHAHTRFEAYQKDPALFRAQLASKLSETVRKRRRAARDKRIEELVAAHCPPEQARLAAAMLNTLISVEIGVALEDRFGLRGDDVTRAAQWGVDVLVEAIRRGRLPQR